MSGHQVLFLARLLIKASIHPPRIHWSPDGHCPLELTGFGHGQADRGNADAGLTRLARVLGPPAAARLENLDLHRIWRNNHRLLQYHHDMTGVFTNSVTEIGPDDKVAGLRVRKHSDTLPTGVTIALGRGHNRVVESDRLRSHH